MLELLALFPRMVNQAANKDFFREISMEALSDVLESFKKNKSPSHDG